MNFEAVERAAAGKWYSVLSMLGIDAEFLVNKHGPCPVCGGKDRFRFDDQGQGLYYCNGCGAGNGFQLLEKFHGWEFRKAVEEVAAVVGNASEAVPQSRGGNPRAALRKAIKGCTEDRGLVVEYLRGRGLSVAPRTLRQHPAMPFYDEGRFVENVPAMLAVVHGPNGEALSLMRTYLKSGLNGARKKMMAPVKPLKGGAIRLFAEAETLGIAEGVETAIAAHELTAIKGSPVPVWSVVSTALMESFEPPEVVKNLIIFADNDDNYAGQKSAYVLAHRLAMKGMRVAVHIPPVTGDWLDWLNNHKKTAE